MNDGRHHDLGSVVCSWGRLRLPHNGVFKESRPNSLGSDSSNWLLYSIIHNRPSSDCSRTISATGCLPAIRRSDGDSQSECNQ